MPDEIVTTASAGPARRPPRRRQAAVAAEALTAHPDLDERERNISPVRKAMGPGVPPEVEPQALGPAEMTTSNVPPTDPR